MDVCYVSPNQEIQKQLAALSESPQRTRTCWQIVESNVMFRSKLAFQSNVSRHTPTPTNQNQKYFINPLGEGIEKKRKKDRKKATGTGCIHQFMCTASTGLFVKCL